MFICLATVVVVRLANCCNLRSRKTREARRQAHGRQKRSREAPSSCDWTVLAVNKTLVQQLSDRIDAIESSKQTKQDSTKDVSDSQSAKRKTKSPATHLSSVWFEWYTREPRLWSSTGNRQKKSQSNQLVAFMKLFFDNGFSLDTTQSDYRDRALVLGDAVELALASFLNERGIVSVGAGSVLKHMRQFHSAGALNTRIARYRAQLAIGQIVDPAPRHTQDIFTIV